MSKSAAVADVGVEAILCLHDEVVGVGNLRGVGNLLVGGIVLAEADVVAEGVVKRMASWLTLPMSDRRSCMPRSLTLMPPSKSANSLRVSSSRPVKLYPLTGTT